MKFNFGHGLFLGAAAFVVFIFFLVSHMLRQDVDLVAKDYYEQGIDFQEQIEKNKLEKTGVFRIRQEGNALLFLSDSLPSQGSYHLAFYRPSDAKMDFIAAVQPKDNQLSFEDSRLTYGDWTVTLSWYENGTEHFSHFKLFWQ